MSTFEVNFPWKEQKIFFIPIFLKKKKTYHYFCALSQNLTISMMQEKAWRLGMLFSQIVDRSFLPTTNRRGCEWSQGQNFKEKWKRVKKFRSQVKTDKDV